MPDDGTKPGPPPPDIAAPGPSRIYFKTIKIKLTNE